MDNEEYCVPSLHSHDEEPESSREMPHASGAEKSILSSMLKEPEECIPIAVEERLVEEAFYVPAHRLLFRVIRSLYDAQKEVELVGLVQYLHDEGLLDDVGGSANISDLYTYATNSARFKSHLGLVKDKYVLRSVIRCSTEAISGAFDNPEDVRELLDDAERNIMAIRENTEELGTFDLGAVADEVVKEFQQVVSGEREEQGLRTGFPDLDRMTKGLKPGEVFVIAARPSMGKTSLMMNMVENLCVDQGLEVAVFSCEMTEKQLIQRLIFSRARYPLARIEKGRVPSSNDLNRIRMATDEVKAAPLWIDDTAGIAIDTLRAKARRRKRERGLSLIAIDYLQLMRSRTRQAAGSREREIGEISGGIKALAKELSVPIIVLAQLNRGPETRKGEALGVPRMADLRESGTIEQDADMIGLLYRKDYYAFSEEEKESLAGQSQMTLAKNRSGETGEVPLTFIGQLMRFENRAHTTEEPR